MAGQHRGEGAVVQSQVSGQLLERAAGATILDAAGFAQAAAGATAGCPVSKALTRVEITLDAELQS